jgi:hypothetical protein
MSSIGQGNNGPRNIAEALGALSSQLKTPLKRTLFEKRYAEHVGAYPNPGTVDADLLTLALYEFSVKLRRLKRRTKGADFNPVRAFGLFLEDPRNVPQIVTLQLNRKVLRQYRALLSSLEVRKKLNIVEGDMSSRTSRIDEREKINARIGLLFPIVNTLRRRFFNDEGLRVLEELGALIDEAFLRRDNERIILYFGWLEIITFYQDGRPDTAFFLKSFSEYKADEEGAGGENGGLHSSGDSSLVEPQEEEIVNSSVTLTPAGSGRRPVSRRNRGTSLKRTSGRRSGIYQRSIYSANIMARRTNTFSFVNTSRAGLRMVGRR